jgi:hypothetical protein
MDTFSIYDDIMVKTWTNTPAFVHLLHFAVLISIYYHITGKT